MISDSRPQPQSLPLWAAGALVTLLEIAVTCACAAEQPAEIEGATVTSTSAALKQQACYGDAIDVDLVDGDGNRKVALTMPLGLFPAISGYAGGGGEFDPFKDCVPEPVAAHSVYFAINHGAVPELGLQAPDVSVRRIWLRYGGEPTADSIAREDAHISEKLSAGQTIQLPNGFTRLDQTQSDAGDYLSPPGVVTPAKRRLIIRCGPMAVGDECYVNYALDNILVGYWFAFGKFDPINWVTLDGLIRSGVNSLRR